MLLEFGAKLEKKIPHEFDLSHFNKGKGSHSDLFEHNGNQKFIPGSSEHSKSMRIIQGAFDAGMRRSEIERLIKEAEMERAWRERVDEF